MGDTLVERLYRDHSKEINAFIRRSTGDSHHSLDLTHDCFLIYLRARGSGMAMSADPRLYLFGIARNLIREDKRGRRRRLAEGSSLNPVIFAADPPTPHEHAAGTQLASLVRRAVLALPVDLRVTLILREYHELRYQEIAEVLDVPVGTVRSRISRAREALATGLVEAGVLSNSGAPR